MHEKAKFVCFIYMQLQKVKFQSVQINMKQVSYIHMIWVIVFYKYNLSRDMRFPTMWYMRQAKAQTSLRMCEV